MDVLTGIALAAPAGLNAYVPMVTVALASRFGIITLDAPYDVLGEWWMIAILSVLLIVEFVADKIPAVDTVNDTIQTFVRPAAGGLLAVAASGAGDIPAPVLVLVGVLLAGSVHAAKASARPAVNASTGGVGGPIASTIEDVTSAVLSVLAFVVPLLVVLVALGFIGLGIYLFVRLRRRFRTG